MANLPVPFPVTEAPGQLITGALWNTQIRDSLNFLLNPPVAVIQATGAQSIPNNAYTAITLGSTVVDSYGGFNAANSSYKAPVSGFYLCTGAIPYVSNTTGTRNCMMKVNGSTNPANGTLIAAAAVGGGTRTMTTVTDLVYLNTNDYVQLYGAQSSGGALNTDYTASVVVASLQVMWIHV